MGEFSLPVTAAPARIETKNTSIPTPLTRFDCNALVRNTTGWNTPYLLSG